MGLRHVLAHGRCVQVPNNSGPPSGRSATATTIAAIVKPGAIIRSIQYEGWNTVDMAITQGKQTTILSLLRSLQEKHLPRSS